MKLSQHLFLVTGIVISIFAGFSNAKLTKSLMKTAETEKFYASQIFQDLEEEIIMKGSDKSSLVAKSVIQAIKDEASKCIADGVPALAVKTAMEGSLAAIKLVAESERKAITAIDAAMDVVEKDPEAASDAIENGIKADTEILFIAGVPIHEAHGTTLVLTGGAATPALKKAIITIQNAGTAILETIDIGKSIAVLGINAGGEAAIEGLKAAHETVATGGITFYLGCFDGTQHAFNGLRNITSNGLIQSDHIPGIIDSLKSTNSIKSTKALAAISRIKAGLQAVLKYLTKKPLIDAANVMAQGLILTISETDEAVAVAKTALEKAGKLTDQDVNEAVRVIHEGMQIAKDGVISSAAGSILGLGAAGKIAGKKAAEGLVPAIIEFEYGRVAGFEELRHAEQTALLGIQTGGLAGRQSTFAAAQVCEAAGNSVYTQIADSADIGFEVLKNIYKEHSES